MSFDPSTNSNSSSDKSDRKLPDRSKGDDLQISRTDMNMLIMNYLVTEGFKEAALKFQQEAGLQEPALCSSLDERIMIREAVQNGRIPDAIAMVNALHPELLDNDRYLYFHLQETSLLLLPCPHPSGSFLHHVIRFAVATEPFYALKPAVL